MNKVLFVCLGNICRSAMAEGVCRAELSRRGIDGIIVDSAGTSDWHIGDAPDARAIEAARRRDIDIAGQKARQICDGDFDEFDLILAMDGSNLAKLRAAAGEHRRGKVRLFLDFARDLAVREVADPYYGGADGFDDTLDLLDIGVRALADHIVTTP
ncbi:MAG: low molecular weight phosphotyrosine protein phosphatase [Rhizobiales bacterium]|nr:low molecular weight phosphotyrosine protein phosphatase [Hyphomicrobiales bacterium]